MSIQGKSVFYFLGQSQSILMLLYLKTIKFRQASVIILGVRQFDQRLFDSPLSNYTYANGFVCGG